MTTLGGNGKGQNKPGGMVTSLYLYLGHAKRWLRVWFQEAASVYPKLNLSDTDVCA